MEMKTIVILTVSVYLVAVGSVLALDDLHLIFYFPFEQFGGDVALDRSGKGHNGTINGDVKLVDDGKRGKAAEFTKGSFIDMDGPRIPRDQIPTEEITLCAWVKCEKTGTHHTIFSARSVDLTWVVHSEVRSEGHFRWALRTYGGVAIFDIRAGSMRPSEWMHFAGVYNGINGILYINGEKVSEQHGGVKIAGDWALGARIGRNVDNSRQFTGLMDDFCLWKRALTQKEIEIVMQEGPENLLKKADAVVAMPPGENAVKTESWNVELVGYCDTPSGAWTPYGVHAARGYAYTVDGIRGDLRVIDVSDPTNPHQIGLCDTPGYAYGVYVAGDYAYVAADGLRVIDVSDPSNPHEVGYCDVYGEEVHVAGDYAYLAGSDLHVIDVSDSTNPRKVGFYKTPGYASGVHIAGKYAYITDRDWLGGRPRISGLRVIDISDPTNPHEIGFYDTPGSAYGVYVAGRYAYVADGKEGLRVIDVSDPRNPHELGSWDAHGVADEVHVARDYAYVAGDVGLQVVDVSDPSDLYEVGFYSRIHHPNSGWVRYDDYEDVHVTEGYAYVTNRDNGLWILRYTAQLNVSVELLGSCKTPGFANAIYVARDYAYVADGESGLRVIGVSDPTNPHEIGSCDIPGYAHGVYVAGDYAYVADGESGLRVISVSDPMNPHEVGFCDTPGGAYEVYIAERYAYVADGESGLRVINVSDPNIPHEVGFCDTQGRACGVHVAGGYAYVAVSSYLGDSLRVMDISDPSNPHEVGFYDLPGWVSGADVASGYAYVAVSLPPQGGSLRIIDVSDPSNLHEVGFYNTPGEASGVHVDGRYAYVTDIWFGLHIIDVSDPLNPHEVGFCDIPVWADEVYVARGYAYVVGAEPWSETNGLFIFTGIKEYPPWDVNADGRIDILDIILIGQRFGEDITTPSDPNPDVSGDGTVNIVDLVLVGRHFGETYSRTAPPVDIWNLAPHYLPLLTKIYNIMEHNPDSGPDFLSTKRLLHRLISNGRITETEVFQNYPNPFNPETLIPFQLSEGSEVEVRIYNSTGHLIRVLDLGFKGGGYYTSPEDSAKWDGRNERGEKVASGVYFYTIRAGKYAATRKMMLVK